MSSVRTCVVLVFTWLLVYLARQPSSGGDICVNTLNTNFREYCGGGGEDRGE